MTISADDLYAYGLHDLGALGDWMDDNKGFFATAKKLGVSGTGLRSLLMAFVPIVQQTSGEWMHEFMYEVDDRPELKSDEKVPDWLLDQIEERTRKALLSKSMTGAAAEVLATLKEEVTKSKYRPAAKGQGRPQALVAVQRGAENVRTRWLVPALIVGGLGLLAVVGAVVVRRRRR